jgi:hypothetical protein
MELAIKNNRTQFVQLFLENGFNLKKFLTYKMLLKFYKEVNFHSL